MTADAPIAADDLGATEAEGASPRESIGCETKMGRRGERRVERRARDATRAGFKFARIATRGAQLSFLAPVPIGTWHPAGGRGEGGRARTCAPASVSAMGEFMSDSATRAARRPTAGVWYASPTDAAGDC